MKMRLQPKGIGVTCLLASEENEGLAQCGDEWGESQWDSLTI
jgi:hypothetical protein